MKQWKRGPGEAVFYISEALIGLIRMPGRASTLLAYQETAVWKVIILNPEKDEQFHGDAPLYRASKTVFWFWMVGEPCLSWSRGSFVSVWSGRLLSSPLTKHLPAEEAAEPQTHNVNFPGECTKTFWRRSFALLPETSIIQPSTACCYLQQQNKPYGPEQNQN